MASSSWQRLGEGFKSGDSGCVSKSRKPLQGKCMGAKSKGNDFLSSFGTRSVKESNPEQIEDISWSASSSDEEDCKARNGTEQDKCLGQRKTKVGKRKRFNVKKRPAADFLLSHHMPKNFKHESSSDTSKSSTRVLSAIEKEAMNDSVSPRFFTAKGEKKIVNKSSTWDCSTFEDIQKLDVIHDIPRRSRKFNVHHEQPFSFSAKQSEHLNIVVCESSSSESEDVNEKVVEDSDEDNAASGCLNPAPQTSKFKTNSVLGEPFLSQDKDSDQETSQEEICSLTSPSVVSVSSTPQKVGASDWADNFRREVSPRSNDGKEMGCLPLNQHDSTKKKHKNSSDSLVGQLTRLINREKSSARFWQHSVSKESTMSAETSSKSVTFHVLSISKHFSFCVTQCQVVDDKDSLLTNSTKTCRVMFVKSLVEKLDIQAGGLLRLFPPWKQLDEGTKTTILCAYQVQVVAGDDLMDKKKTIVSDISTTKDSLAVVEKVKLTLRWTCPCKDNPSVPANQCPAHQSDHYVQFFSQMSVCQNPTSTTHPVHFHSVQSSGHPIISHGHSLPPPSSAVHGGKSLIHSIQEERAGGMDCMPPFNATVLRVFRQKVSTQNAIRLSVLLEDVSGTVALIQQQQEKNPMSFRNLVGMEGKECLFKNLTMVTRRTKDRDYSLFQVISRVWKGGTTLQADSQDDNTPLSQKSRKIPSFCYILQPLEESSMWLQTSEKEQGSQDGLELESLSQSVKVSCGQRFSCLAKLIDVQTCSPQSSETRKLYVCDPLDDEKSYTPFYPLTFDIRCVGLERKKAQKLTTCLLRDVSWNGTAVLGDDYSCLLSYSVWHELGIDKRISASHHKSITSHQVVVPLLCHAATSDSFVKVSGPVVNIDAEKCYMWKGCGGCGKELTVTDTTGFPMCVTCDSNKYPPVSCMNMEVEILEETCKDCVVNIDLSQRTISDLLPEEVPSEGYDMDQVLGKPINAIAYVVNRKDGAINLHQIDI